jgi:osmotically-inducible protein OsmY
MSTERGDALFEKGMPRAYNELKHPLLGRQVRGEREESMITKKVLNAGYLAGLVAMLALMAWPVWASGQDQNAAAKARIEQKFKEEGLLLGSDIRVTVENKTVTLTGTARTLAVKEQAGREAQAAAKGFKLVNDIALADSGLSPQQIAEGIMTAIDASPSYYIFDYVGVGVGTDGVATLKGWTYYPASATEFVKLAQAQPGARKVVNEIRRIMVTDADQALRLQVARLIYTRPTMMSFSRMNGPVHILVNNGVVTLGGFVDKESDVDGFERLVRFNTGALNVVNALQVRKK